MQLTLSKALINLVAFMGLISTNIAIAEEKHNHHIHQHKKVSTISEQIIDLMHKPMMQTPFLESDQGAIDASEMLLKHSKNQRVRAQAQAIIKEQKAEIKEFESLIPQLQEQKKLYSPKEVTLFNNQAKTDMEAMMKAMNETKLHNRIDYDFLSSMIPHHQGAIDASKQILQYTQNEQIKTIAKHIIQTQEKEIETFKTILKNIR